MAVKCKRYKRRQQALERAYWHVREVMEFIGCRVTAEPLVPVWIEPDWHSGKSLLAKYKTPPLGLYTRPFVVGNVPGDHWRYREMVLHECCHANQPGIADDSDVEIDRESPYSARPHEIEAFVVSDIASILWNSPKEEWYSRVTEYRNRLFHS